MCLPLTCTQWGFLLLAIFVMIPSLKCYVAILGLTVLNWISGSDMEMFKQNGNACGLKRAVMKLSNYFSQTLQILNARAFRKQIDKHGF